MLKVKAPSFKKASATFTAANSTLTTRDMQSYAYEQQRG